jgi:hypothetical protein
MCRPKAGETGKVDKDRYQAGIDERARRVPKKALHLMGLRAGLR